MRTSHQLYSLGLRLFLVSISLSFASILILFAGIGQLGAGHGSAALWYIGLFIAAVTWLTLAMSCAAGLIGLKRDPYLRMPAWLLLSALILLASIALGAWELIVAASG